MRIQKMSDKTAESQKLFKHLWCEINKNITACSPRISHICGLN